MVFTDFCVKLFFGGARPLPSCQLDAIRDQLFFNPRHPIVLFVFPASERRHYDNRRWSECRRHERNRRTRLPLILSPGGATPLTLFVPLLRSSILSCAPPPVPPPLRGRYTDGYHSGNPPGLAKTLSVSHFVIPHLRTQFATSTYDRLSGLSFCPYFVTFSVVAPCLMNLRVGANSPSR